MNSTKIELLAPAGGPEALLAAVRCGADAVYLGGRGFNARRGAAGFSPDELERAAAACRLYGVKLYYTLNTLIKEGELDDALAEAETARRIGADAILTQDWGLAAAIRRAAPDMPLHASTQMSVHTPAGVRELARAGFSRVVLAREMSFDEIGACAGLGVELEVFVHGALCMSVSGQCALSQAFGERSANRGMCAQPCRLPFRYGRSEHALSLRDLCALDYVGALKAAGVAALKIEGRMKRPEYVAAASSLYRRALDGEMIAQTDVDELRAVFSRSGFTDGYLSGRRGGAMFGVRTKDDVQAAAPVLRKFARLYDREQPRVPLTGAFTLHAGLPARLALSDGAHEVSVTGGVPEPALTRPLDEEAVRAQLSKTGGTPYYFTELTAGIEAGLNLSPAALNAVRRDALAELSRLREEFAPKPFAAAQPAPARRDCGWSAKTIVRLASAEQYSPKLDGLADVVALPLSKWRPCAACAEIPRGMFGIEEQIRRELSRAASGGAKYALCGNLGAIPLALEAGLTPIGGSGLNITNAQSLAAYAELGLAAATLSPELRFSETGFARGVLPAGLLVYGHLPLMLTRNCPKLCAGGRCDSCRPEDGLRDRTNAVFPVMCDGNCAELLNSVPLYWADKLNELPELDFRLLWFTAESAERTAQIARAYRDGGPPPEKFTRGAYRQGVR